MVTMIEVLVVLHMSSGTFSTAAADDIRAHYTVVASMPPRLFVLRTTPNEAESLRSQAGIAAVTTDPSTIDVRPPLSEGERLFAAGWTARGAKSGPRAGEGLPWDAPGFEPPGAPRK